MNAKRPFVQAAMRSAEMGHLADEVARLEEAGIDGLHFDVGDGIFGPEIAIGPAFVRGLRKYTKLPFEVHLLVNEPRRCLDSYVDAGSERILIHYEACVDLKSSLLHLRGKGCKAGIAVNPTTAIERLKPFMDLIDKVNMMTIDPLIPGVVSERGVQNLSDMAQLSLLLGGKHSVQADGAVSMKTRDAFVEAGADALIVGYPLFSSQNYKETVTGFHCGVLR